MPTKPRRPAPMSKPQIGNDAPLNPTCGRGKATVDSHLFSRCMQTWCRSVVVGVHVRRDLQVGTCVDSERTSPAASRALAGVHAAPPPSLT